MFGLLYFENTFSNPEIAYLFLYRTSNVHIVAVNLDDQPALLSTAAAEHYRSTHTDHKIDLKVYTNTHVHGTTPDSCIYLISCITMA